MTKASLKNILRAGALGICLLSTPQTVRAGMLDDAKTFVQRQINKYFDDNIIEIPYKEPPKYKILHNTSQEDWEKHAKIISIESGVAEIYQFTGSMGATPTHRKIDEINTTCILTKG